MKWTMLDNCLVTVVVLAFVFASQPSAKSACVSGQCVQILYYALDNLAPLTDGYREYDYMECGACVAGANCNDQGLEWGQNCTADTETEQRVRELQTGDLECTLAPQGSAEAKNPVQNNPESPWLILGDRKYCD
jgi:hypothetical protein